MSYILAIDPGSTESAYALIDAETCQPLEVDKLPNIRLLDNLIGLSKDADVAIEMVESFGMAVGREVFETCVWIGRFAEWLRRSSGDPALVYRGAIKMHHCHTRAAKDANITQALVDRFAPGQPNKGKGTKAAPGWFHGFKADIWQAYALAVYVADVNQEDAA